MAGDEAMSAFSGPPQPVEVFHRGAWYAGEMLGWRHEPDGRCRARVRCVVNGLRHSAWMDLADLRLPQSRRPAGPQTSAALPSASPPVPQPARPAAVEFVGRHRMSDGDTRPHLLLLDRGQRSRPPVPAPRRPVTHGRLSTV